MTTDNGPYHSAEDNMETLAISKFKATCPAVLEDVRRQKKRVVITKRGQPIAETVPIDHQMTDIPLKDTVLFIGDIISLIA